MASEKGIKEATERLINWDEIVKNAKKNKKKKEKDEEKQLK